MVSLIFKIFIFCSCFSLYLSAANVGLLVMATGKYINFVPPLVESAKTYFCKNHQVTYFILTDGHLPPMQNVVTLFQSRLGWPFDTMMRYHSYLNYSDLLMAQDYLFACDADMLFLDEVGEEILGERVATQHPGFVNRRGTYETNPDSSACVYPDEGELYFAGGFYGGTAEEMLTICRHNATLIDRDLANGLIAVWHDESHWNRYCIDYPPTVILDPSYCYPENWKLPFKRKLIALDKNHIEMRQN